MIISIYELENKIDLEFASYFEEEIMPLLKQICGINPDKTAPFFNFFITILILFSTAAIIINLLLTFYAVDSEFFIDLRNKLFLYSGIVAILTVLFVFCFGNNNYKAIDDAVTSKILEFFSYSDNLLSSELINYLYKSQLLDSNNIYDIEGKTLIDGEYNNTNIDISNITLTTKINIGEVNSKSEPQYITVKKNTILLRVKNPIPKTQNNIYVYSDGIDIIKPDISANKIQIPDIEFSKNYMVYSDSSEYVLEFLNLPFRDLLLEYKRKGIYITLALLDGYLNILIDYNKFIKINPENGISYYKKKLKNLISILSIMDVISNQHYIL